jgi:hypothetical protein
MASRTCCSAVLYLHQNLSYSHTAATSQDLPACVSSPKSPQHSGLRPATMSIRFKQKIEPMPSSCSVLNRLLDPLFRPPPACMHTCVFSQPYQQVPHCMQKKRSYNLIRFSCQSNWINVGQCIEPVQVSYASLLHHTVVGLSLPVSSVSFIFCSRNDWRM